MSSHLLQRFLGRIVERLTALTLGGLAAQSEADAAIHEAECLDRLEEAARHYESAGKPHLAARLRSRASMVNADDPGAMATASLLRLTGSASEPPLAISDAVEGSDASDLPLTRRRRRSAKGEAEA